MPGLWVGALLHSEWFNIGPVFSHFAPYRDGLNLFVIPVAPTGKPNVHRAGPAMMFTIRRLIAQFISLMILAGELSACGGGGGGGGDGGGAAAPPVMTPPPTTFGPNFSEIQANVFTTTCAVSGCHLGGTAPHGLQLDETNSYMNLVDVASVEVPNLLRVEAGNPDDSYIIQKLEGTAASGDRMPLNRPPLAASVIATMRQWITDGAIDDRAASMSAVSVSTISPPPDSVLSSAPTQIRVEFDRDPDASTVNANTFLLEASGGDQSFGDGNETRILATSISVPAANTRSAVFDLSGVTLQNDTYRVILLGTGASVLLDMDANALAGGDFVVEFTLQGP